MPTKNKQYNQYTSPLLEIDARLAKFTPNRITDVNLQTENDMVNMKLPPFYTYLSTHAYTTAVDNDTILKDYQGFLEATDEDMAKAREHLLYILKEYDSEENTAQYLVTLFSASDSTIITGVAEATGKMDAATLVLASVFENSCVETMNFLFQKVDARKPNIRNNFHYTQLRVNEVRVVSVTLISQRDYKELEKCLKTR